MIFDVFNFIVTCFKSAGNFIVLALESLGVFDIFVCFTIILLAFRFIIMPLFSFGADVRGLPEDSPESVTFDNVTVNDVVNYNYKTNKTKHTKSTIISTTTSTRRKG